jgi:hypothetical protein
MREIKVGELYRSLATGRLLRVIYVEHALIHFHNGECHGVTVVDTAQLERVEGVVE